MRAIPAGSGLRFAVLGPVRGWYGEEELALGSPQQVATLVALLLRGGRPASTAQLVDAIWGDDPPRAAVETLRTYISRLRRVLNRADAVALDSYGDGYILRVGDDASDLAVFDRLVATAEEERVRGELSAAAGHLHEALSLWHCVALAGVPGPFAELERDRLGERRLAVLSTRLDLDLALYRHADVTAELTALTAEFPLREGFRAQLMLALYRSGRQAEALAVYQDARRTLTDQLGIEPGPALRELQQRILGADPDLGAAARPAAPPLTPAQLPADLSDFTGRESVVAELRDELTSARPAVVVIAVAGLGGVGKTTLAVHVGHAVREHFPDGQLYLDLRGMSEQPSDPGVLLAAVLATLGVAENAQPVAVVEKAALYRSLLTTRRMLVVLDDAYDAEQATWLIPGSASCAVVVTSRRLLTGIAAARSVNVDVLDADESAALLARIVGARRVRAEADGARDLVDACGRLPLAIRIVGARLVARPQWPIAAVAQRLRDDQRRFAELRTGHLAIDSTFDLGYRQLTEQQARIFRWLAITEAPSLSVAAAAAIADMRDDEVEPIVESLVDLNLVDAFGLGQYRYHNLVREYARQCFRSADGAPVRAQVLGRLVDFYLASARNAHRLIEAGSGQPEDTVATTVTGIVPRDAATARDWLLTEHLNIIAAVRQLAEDRAADVDKLADLLLMLVRLGVYGADWQQLERTASSVAELARGLGNARAEGRARYLCGRLLSERHRFEEALPILQTAAARAAVAADARTWERARAREGVAHAHYGDLDLAERCFTDALQEGRQLGDRQRSAITLGNLARVALLRGDPATALDLARQSTATAEQAQDRMASMYSTLILGRAYLDGSRTAEATRTLTAALRLAAELAFRSWVGVCNMLLARSRIASESWPEAIDQAELAIGIARQLADPYLECDALIELGRALTAVGQLDRGRASWVEARRLTEHFAACCVEQYASTLSDLGA